MNKFENRDCMEGMMEYPDKYFELAIVDPPYGGCDHLVNRVGGGWAHKYGKKINKWDIAPSKEGEYYARKI